MRRLLLKATRHESYVCSIMKAVLPTSLLHSLLPAAKQCGPCQIHCSPHTCHHHHALSAKGPRPPSIATLAGSPECTSYYLLPWPLYGSCQDACHTATHEACTHQPAVHYTILPSLFLWLTVPPQCTRTTSHLSTLSPEDGALHGLSYL